MSTEPVTTEETTEGRRTNALAAILCADAQELRYDHGSQPTLVSFDPPFCSRHLVIAANVLAELRSVR